jgi:hypothetical protein
MRPLLPRGGARLIQGYAAHTHFLRIFQYISPCMHIYIHISVLFYELKSGKSENHDMQRALKFNRFNLGQKCRHGHVSGVSLLVPDVYERFYSCR